MVLRNFSAFPYVLVLGGSALLLVALVWGLMFAPEDYQQGNSFRIIYLHVPTAILAQSCYMMMAACAIVSLVWKMKVMDWFITSAAPLGMAFTFLALFTGAVWGKPTWGTWWVWDARLTSMLVLLFLYLGVIALSNAFDDEAAAEKAVKILVLVGVVNIPIIKYSVEWWNTLHQPATFTVTEKPAMPPEMWVPLLLAVIGIYAWYLALLFARVRGTILLKERRTNWVKTLLKEQ